MEGEQGHTLPSPPQELRSNFTLQRIVNVFHIFFVDLHYCHRNIRIANLVKKSS